MLKHRFAHRVAVYRGFAMFYRSGAAVDHLLKAGLATVRRRVERTITEVELTKFAVGYMQGTVDIERLGLKPGSFGIHVVNFESGAFCFEHRKPWSEVLPQ